MEISPRIEEYMRRGLAGEGFEADELIDIFNVEPYSQDYYALLWAHRKLDEDACDKTGEVHAQIGIDALPCPMDCKFCSFAVSNNKRPAEDQIMPLDEIIEYANMYKDLQVNTLTLMITVDYDFERYLEVIAAVREAIGPETPIMANMGDFSVKKAERMKAAGVGSFYHAVRMGEGTDTLIPIEKRFETMEAGKSIGLKLATCAESIGPEYDDRMIADIMLRMAAIQPEQECAAGRVNVENTRGEKEPSYAKARMEMYRTAFRFACGPKTRFGCGTYRWAEVGTNPRDHSSHTEKDGLVSQTTRSVEHLREDLEADGYKAYLGPSPWW